MRPPQTTAATKKGLVGAGGDGVGGAVEEAITEAAGPFVSVGHFGNLEEFLMQFTQADFDGFFLFRATDAEAQKIPGFLLGGPALGAARNVSVVPTHNFVADLQAAFCDGTIGVHSCDHPGPRS